MKEPCRHTKLIYKYLPIIAQNSVILQQIWGKAR